MQWGAGGGGLWEQQWGQFVASSVSSVLPESGIVADIDWEPAGGGGGADNGKAAPGEPPPGEPPGHFYSLKSQPLPHR